MLLQRHAILIYKMKTISIHDNETSKIYTDLNPAVSQDPQTYHMKKLTEIEAYFLDEIEVRQILTKKKKNETIQYYHKCGRRRSNNTNSC